MTDNVKGFPRRGTNEKLPQRGTNEKLPRRGTNEKLPQRGTNEKLAQKGTSEKFWQRFQSGIDVAVGGDLPDKLLGVREGFVRYFHHGLERSVPVSVKPQPLDEARTPLPVSDEDILSLARHRALELQRLHGDAFTFHVGTEAGLLLFEIGGQTRHFVRSWTVILGLDEETWGSSGSVQLPQRLIQGLDRDDLPFVVPGTRRSGGMVSSLTGSLETRRSATALATFHALSTLMYGRLESHPHRRRVNLQSGRQPTSLG